MYKLKQSEIKDSSVSPPLTWQTNSNKAKQKDLFSELLTFLTFFLQSV